LREPNAADPLSVKHARVIEMNNIQNWIQEYNEIENKRLEKA